MQTQDLKYWLAWSRLSGLGPIRIKRMIDYFPDLKIAWQADSSELLQAGLEKNIVDSVQIEKNQINPDELLSELAKNKIKAICLGSNNYPKYLKQIYDPPAVLYYRGQLLDEKPLIAVVGTRKISTYGNQIVKQIIPELVNQHLGTVSGLALGIDSLVHQITVESGGTTIAVLGSGLDDQNIYPSSNRFLSQKIINSGGLLMSEYPPGTLPLKQHFPKRNRLISGLAHGVLVIEGGISSGSLITARIALEQNREVMAVPGSIFADNSSGTNQLIKQGATPVIETKDIINCLDLQLIVDLPAKEHKTDDATEALLINILGYEPSSLDEIIRKTDLPTAIIISKLNILEIKGIIKNIQHNMFAKIR